MDLARDAGCGHPSIKGLGHRCVGYLTNVEADERFKDCAAAFGCLIVLALAGMSPLVAPILFFPLLAEALLTLPCHARRGRSFHH